MNRLLLALITVSFFSIAGISKAQDNSTILCDSFVLNVQIQNKDTGKVLLMYFGCDNNGASGYQDLINGKARFSGTINRASEALLFTNPDVRNLDDSSVIRLILEPHTISLSCSISNNQAKNILIEGSVAQSQKDKWEADNVLLVLQRENYRNSIAELLNNSGYSDSSLLNAQLEKLIAKSNAVRTQLLQSAFHYISTHPDSHLGGYLLNKYHLQMPLDTLKKYYLLQNQVVQHSYFGRAVLDYLYSLSDSSFRKEYDYDNLSEELKTIKTLHDVTLADSSGNAVSVAKFKGRPSLLFFWGSWCGPCHKQAPLLQSLMNEIGTDSLHLISISLNTNPEEWKESMKKFEVPGINLIDTRNILRVFYRFLAVPRYIIVDKAGNIINDDAPGAGTGKLKELLLAQIRN